MTPREKAKELIIKFMEYVDDIDYDGFENIRELKKNAKHCALIAVDEIIEEKETFEPYGSRIEWWQQVKEEIKKL